jgi:hypothetical protein
MELRWRVWSRRGVDAGISKAPTYESSERIKGHNGVRTTGVEKECIMACVQDVSCFQEGADDGNLGRWTRPLSRIWDKWADRGAQLCLSWREMLALVEQNR